MARIGGAMTVKEILKLADTYGFLSDFKNKKQKLAFVKRFKRCERADLKVLKKCKGNVDLAYAYFDRILIF